MSDSVPRTRSLTAHRAGRNQAAESARDRELPDHPLLNIPIYGSLSEGDGEAAEFEFPLDPLDHLIGREAESDRLLPLLGNNKRSGSSVSLGVSFLLLLPGVVIHLLLVGCSASRFYRRG
jgi:hypothetical protein